MGPKIVKLRPRSSVGTHRGFESHPLRSDPLLHKGLRAISYLCYTLATLLHNVYFLHDLLVPAFASSRVRDRWQTLKPWRCEDVIQ